MKKIVKTLAMPMLAIALCLSLMSGATFALFTSSSNVDITVTSGKVDLSATVVDLGGFSAVYDAASGTHTSKPVDVANKFDMGGTYAYDETSGKLELANIVAGDGVTFKISFVNNSTVGIKYRTRFQVAEGSDTALFANLKISVSGMVIDGSNVAVSPWTAVSGDIEPIDVRIELPIEAKDCMDMACELSIIVEAVQGNAHTVDYVISTVDDLNAKLDEVESGGSVQLTEDLTVEEGNIEIEGDKDLTLDLAGNSLQIEDTGADGIVARNGANLTITNSGTEGAYTYSTTTPAYSNYNAIFVTNDDPDTTTSVTFEDVEIDVSDDSGKQIAVYVVGDAGKAQVDFNEGCVFNMESNNQSFCGFYIEGLAEMNIDGGIINVDGVGDKDITGISIDTNYGNNSDTIVNFNAGEINVRGSGSILGIEFGNGGTLNMSDGATINVVGTGNPEAIGVGINYYGVINMLGGSITIETKSGPGYGLSSSPHHTEYAKSEVHIGSGASITAAETEDGRNVEIEEEFLTRIQDETESNYTDERVKS